MCPKILQFRRSQISTNLSPIDISPNIYSFLFLFNIKNFKTCLMHQLININFVLSPPLIANITWLYLVASHFNSRLFDKVKYTWSSNSLTLLLVLDSSNLILSQFPWSLFLTNPKLKTFQKLIRVLNCSFWGNSCNKILTTAC